MEHIGTFKPDNLCIARISEFDRSTRTIPAGVEVKRGMILNSGSTPITSGGNVDCIALDNIGAVDNMRVCTVAEMGVFNIKEVLTGDATTAADWYDALRSRSILLRQPAP